VLGKTFADDPTEQVPDREAYLRIVGATEPLYLKHLQHKLKRRHYALLELSAAQPRLHTAESWRMFWEDVRQIAAYCRAFNDGDDAWPAWYRANADALDQAAAALEPAAWAGRASLAAIQRIGVPPNPDEVEAAAARAAKRKR
jgi:hypothetical protein